MALKKEQKGEVLTKLKNILSTSQSVVFVNFHGLSVFNANQIRKALRSRNIGYVVAKKTPLKTKIMPRKKIGVILS